MRAVVHFLEAEMTVIEYGADSGFMGVFAFHHQNPRDPMGSDLQKLGTLDFISAPGPDKRPLDLAFLQAERPSMRVRARIDVQSPDVLLKRTP